MARHTINTGRKYFPELKAALESRGLDINKLPGETVRAMLDVLQEVIDRKGKE